MGAADNISVVGEAPGGLPHPLPPAPGLEAIPGELRELDQWVLCSISGKKVPLNPRTLRWASTTNPGSWGTFAQVVKLWEAHRGLGLGVGFVFRSGGGITGVDLGGCRDPESGAVEPWAREIISRLNSYSEVSPSGEGVHIIVKATVPGAGRKARRGTGVVQFRGEKFFFAMTGHHLPETPHTIEDRQGALSAVYFESFEWGPEVEARGRVWKGNPRAALRAVAELVAESDYGGGRVPTKDLVGRIMRNQECGKRTAEEIIHRASRWPYRLIRKGAGFRGYEVLIKKAIVPKPQGNITVNL